MAKKYAEDYFVHQGQIGGVTRKLKGGRYAFEDKEFARRAAKKSVQTRLRNRHKIDRSEELDESV